MFTGLIEKVAKLKNIVLTHQGAVLSIENPFDDVKLGDSIAINGACLTVSKMENNILYFDVMRETLNLTNLKDLKADDEVNLERALLITSRLDGHVVSGHIDCVSAVKEIVDDGFSKRVEFSCDSSLIIKKGSIAVNGVSLTVVDVFENGFSVSLIPTTFEKTNLKNLKIGDIVNIEYDVIAKYINKFTKNEENSKITMEFLKENGF